MQGLRGNKTASLEEMIIMIFPFIEHLLRANIICNLYDFQILLLILTTTSKVDAINLILQIEN